MPSTANGAFATPVLLPNETAATNATYRFALAGGTGVTVASGDSITLRLYYSSGSGSNGRYAKLKNVQVKGFAANATLPLNILSFNAGYVNNSLKVLWNTSNEVDARSYGVERSVDGRAFTAIGSVAAKNASGSNSYELVDANPLSGVIYYRLKMTDKDGSFRYSKVVIVNSRLRGIVSLYPNPATNLLTVTHGKANINATVQVTAVNGRRMITQTLMPGALQTAVGVANLAAGTYTLVIINGTERTNMKFVKQ
jgi:hypothetical protein